MQWIVDHWKRSFAQLFCLLFSLNVYAAQWATVTSEKAPVFSDVQMSSVIGFISKGKRIRVGEVPKNKGRLLPVIVNKKIAYIQIDDISMAASADAIVSATQRIREKMNRKIDERRISAFAGTMLGNVYFDSTERNEESYNLLFLSLGIRGYYRKIGEATGIRTGIEYFYGPKDEETLSWASVNVDYTWPALTTNLYDMVFFVGGIFAPFAQYEVDDLFTITGYGFGAHGGVDMRFALPGNWSLQVEGAYHSLKLFEMDLPENNLYGDILNPWVNGIKTSVAISYEY